MLVITIILRLSEVLSHKSTVACSKDYKTQYKQTFLITEDQKILFSGTRKYCFLERAKVLSEDCKTVFQAQVNDKDQTKLGSGQVCWVVNWLHLAGGQLSGLLRCFTILVF